MSTAPPATFDRAGKYRLGALLGEGGMAQVYRGAIVGNDGFEREVAIKRVLAEWSANPSFVEMFRNEARLASLLHHDNIVAVLDFDRDLDDRLFQVLEFVRGRDLEKLMSTGPVPMPVAAYVIGEVLRALDHAHRARNPATGRPLGIVHRDCTPSNVLMTYEGRVKLSDFGVAKAVLSTAATQSGLPKGKPAYMSPEQLQGDLDLDGRSDLFAVGVMLWELITHRPLFTGDTHHQVMSKVLLYGRELDPLPPLGPIEANIPVGFLDIVKRLLAPKRAQRPATAAAALTQLRPWIPVDGTEQLAALLASRFPGEGGRPVAQLATVHGGFGPRGTETMPAPGTTTASVGEVSPHRRGGRWPIAVASGAAAVVAIGVALAVTMGGGGETAGNEASAPVDSAAGGSPLDMRQAAATSSTMMDAGVPVDAGAPSDSPDPLAVDAGAVAPTHVDAGTRRRRSPRDGGSAGSSKHQIYEMDLGKDDK